MKYKKLNIPDEGQIIRIEGSTIRAGDNPKIPFIEGDGIGPDIMKASMRVWNAAVEKAYSGERKIVWFEIFASEKANEKYGEYLPEETISAIKEYIVAIKGPLTTPVGGGFRSLNVTLRQVLDLYACVRPVRYFKGVPSPVTEPEKMDVVIFRENTEDVYAGIEWAEGSEEAKNIIKYLSDIYRVNIRADSGIGIKPVSATGSKRLIKKAIDYAINKNRESVTLVHKGNIMKYTEGAFRDWGYELAKQEYPERTISEEDPWNKYNGKVPEGRIIIKDRIADSMFQQILTRTDEYDVIATTNLNGDYLSDACAAQVGGLGVAPGANIGDEIALFEATHGTAPKYANQDKVNPGSVLLSGVMLLEYIGWNEAANLTTKALEKTILQKKVTYDLARLLGDVKPLKTSEFATEIIKNLKD